MITEHIYEMFIRNGFGSGRNLSIGADADIWRAYEGAYGAFSKTGELVDLKNPSKELLEYNRQSIEIKNYIMAALGKYREHGHLNSEQKEELRLLQQDLLGGFGIDKLAIVIESANGLMQSKFDSDVKVTGELIKGAYETAAKDLMHQQRNFFGSLARLDLSIVQVPFKSEDNNENEFEFSEDLSTCKAVFYVHPTYDDKGVITSIIQPFEFRSTVGDFLREIQSDLQHRAKDKK